MYDVNDSSRLTKGAFACFPSRWLGRYFPMFGFAIAVAAADDKKEPIRPTEPIKLFNGKDFSGLTAIRN